MITANKICGYEGKDIINTFIIENSKCIFVYKKKLLCKCKLMWQKP